MERQLTDFFVQTRKHVKSHPIFCVRKSCNVTPFCQGAARNEEHTAALGSFGKVHRDPWIRNRSLCYKNNQVKRIQLGGSSPESITASSEQESVDVLISSFRAHRSRCGLYDNYECAWQNKSPSIAIEELNSSFRQ